METNEIIRQGSQELPEVLRGALNKSALLADRKDKQGQIALNFHNQQLVFNLFRVNQISHIQLAYLIREAAYLKESKHLPSIVICPVIYPKIAEKLAAENINYIDGLGNICIREGSVYIYHHGKKQSVKKAAAKSRLFGEAGLRVLFALLQSETALQLTYRQLAEMIQVSPASITIIFKELLKEKFLHEGNVGTKQLIRKEELIERWVSGYREILRPKIFINTYTTFNKDLIRNFRSLDISQWDGRWTGEPAGAIYTDYLIPGTLSLFVNEKTKGWMKKMSLVPDSEKSEITILRYFYDEKNPLFGVKDQTVPPLLAYAELAMSDDSRVLETAQKIYDEYLRVTRR